MVILSRLSTQTHLNAQTMIFMYEHGSSFLKLFQALKEGQVVRSWTRSSCARLILLLFITMLHIDCSFQQGYCDLNKSTPWISNDTSLQDYIEESAADVCLPEMSNATTHKLTNFGSSICSIISVETRTKVALNKSLTFCDAYTVSNVIGNETCLGGSYTDCMNCTAHVESLDRSAKFFYDIYEGVMDRFDCVRCNFSVNWNCTDCQKVYKNWVCAMVIPVYVNGTLQRPCVNFCTEVERQCPYFLPDIDTQYGGHPSFICKDHSLSSSGQHIDGTESVYGSYEQCHHIGLQVPENITSTSAAAGQNTLVNLECSVILIVHILVHLYSLLLS